jgi:hypothetical protein
MDVWKEDSCKKAAKILLHTRKWQIVVVYKGIELLMPFGISPFYFMLPLLLRIEFLWPKRVATHVIHTIRNSVS